MNEETTPQNQTTPVINPPTQNPFKPGTPVVEDLSARERVLAGILLILFTLIPILLILAYWPDRIPKQEQKLKPLYIQELYHMQLACIPDDVCCVDTFYITQLIKTSGKDEKTDSTKKQADTTTSNSSDTNNVKETSDNKAADLTTQASPKSAGGDDLKQEVKFLYTYKKYTSDDLIDLNSIILILVALGGFLGNMIHIATSFTNFVGTRKFVRSWTLWYTVKPFTASALALGLHFVSRGGILNYSVDASGVNLYGILTLSILTGLFTDRATLKLGEIFDVIFSVRQIPNSDSRSDKMDGILFTIKSVNPEKIKLGGQNLISIEGENLLKIKAALINTEPVAFADRSSTTATIKYTVPETQKSVTAFVLVLRNEQDKDIYTRTLAVDANDANAADTHVDNSPASSVNDETGDADDDVQETGNEQPFVKE